MWAKLFVFLSIVTLSVQRSTPEDDHYIAAAVEYEVSGDVEQNRLNYIRLIGEAAAENADIIVFPELTLTNNSVSLPVPIRGLLQTYPIPALYPDLYDNLLVSMSAAARQHEVYLLVNVRELLDCTRNDTGEECPEERQYIFNTNVIFDRSGAVIDRYRKINLFGEYSHTSAFHPDLGVFTTDFGVTFGHYICFDLMFQVPSIQVVQQRQLTDVLFSTMWFSELPYLTAVQAQEGYAYAMNVNFIGAGANNVDRGSTGSGIYSGKAGALISVMSGQPLTKVLVAKVPKIPGDVKDPVTGPIYDDPNALDRLVLIRDPSIPSHVSKPLVNGFQQFALVDKDVSCTFRVRLNLVDDEGEPQFRAFVQDGSNTYARREIGVTACSIVACETDDIKTCAFRYNSTKTNSRIEELHINMKTYNHQYNSSLQCDNVIYFPFSFTTSKYPINPKNTTFKDSFENQIFKLSEIGRNENKFLSNDIPIMDVKQNGGGVRNQNGRDDVTFQTVKPQSDIVSFGIWGRIFTRDVDHNKKVTDKDIEHFETILDTIYGVA